MKSNILRFVYLTTVEIWLAREHDDFWELTFVIDEDNQILSNESYAYTSLIYKKPINLLEIIKELLNDKDNFCYLEEINILNYIGYHPGEVAFKKSHTYKRRDYEKGNL